MLLVPQVDPFLTPRQLSLEVESQIFHKAPQVSLIPLPPSRYLS